MEWESFHWDRGMIRIEPIEYFLFKSEDSIGDVPTDPELMEAFRGVPGPSAPGSSRDPSPGRANPRVTYIHYRCQQHFERLTAWLRQKERRPQSRPGGIGTANEWRALKTALYWDSSDPRGKADNDQNTWKICM
jgi:hypothetical protein